MNREGKYKGYNRTKPYVEDSTKGSAQVNPVTYKGDALVQVWLDSRVLASLSNWLDEDGNVTRFMSDVVRDSLQILCEHLESIEEIKMIDSTVDARRLLEMKYRVNLNPQGRGKRNALHNIILSDKRQSLGRNVRKRGLSGQPKSSCTISDEAIRSIAENTVNKFRANRSVESGVVREGMSDDEMAERDRLDREKTDIMNKALDEAMKDNLNFKPSDNE